MALDIEIVPNQHLSYGTIKSKHCYITKYRLAIVGPEMMHILRRMMKYPSTPQEVLHIRILNERLFVHEIKVSNYDAYYITFGFCAPSVSTNHGPTEEPCGKEVDEPSVEIHFHDQVTTMNVTGTVYSSVDYERVPKDEQGRTILRADDKLVSSFVNPAIFQNSFVQQVGPKEIALCFPPTASLSLNGPTSEEPSLADESEGELVLVNASSCSEDTHSMDEWESQGEITQTPLKSGSSDSFTPQSILFLRRISQRHNDRFAQLTVDGFYQNSMAQVELFKECMS